MIIYILLVLILIAVLYFIYLQKTSKPIDINLPEALKALADQNNDKLNDKKNEISELVERVLKELEKNKEKSSNLEEQIKNEQRLYQQLNSTTNDLKNILSSNQTRGAFGEKIAEDLLKQTGFVLGTSYSKQESLGQSRPDFTIFLPDKEKTKINVDSKFPLNNFKKMIETEDQGQREQLKKLFEQDIRKKISEVTGRDYINPEEHTVDFVVLFIPNEMIFSYIYEQFNNLMEDAYNKKVVFAGPFSFTAILHLVSQAYENFHFQENVANIIGYIKKFAEEFENYNLGFKEIGTKIDSLTKQYNAVETTRTNQLVKIVNKIKSEDKSDTPQLHD